MRCMDGVELYEAIQDEPSAIALFENHALFVDLPPCTREVEVVNDDGEIEKRVHGSGKASERKGDKLHYRECRVRLTDKCQNYCRQRRYASLPYCPHGKAQSVAQFARVANGLAMRDSKERCVQAENVGSILRRKSRSMIFKAFAHEHHRQFRALRAPGGEVMKYVVVDETYFGQRKPSGEKRVRAGGPLIFLTVTELIPPAEGNDDDGSLTFKAGRSFWFPVPNRARKTLLPIILQFVNHESVVFTDSLSSYAPLADYVKCHITVNNETEFLDEHGDHTSLAEWLQSFVKKQLKSMGHGRYGPTRELHGRIAYILATRGVSCATERFRLILQRCRAAKHELREYVTSANWATATHDPDDPSAGMGDDKADVNAGCGDAADEAAFNAAETAADLLNADASEAGAAKALEEAARHDAVASIRAALDAEDQVAAGADAMVDDEEVAESGASDGDEADAADPADGAEPHDLTLIIRAPAAEAVGGPRPAGDADTPAFDLLLTEQPPLARRIPSVQSPEPATRADGTCLPREPELPGQRTKAARTEASPAVSSPVSQ